MSTTQTLPLAPLQDALDASEPAQWLKQFCHDRDLPLWVFGGAIRDTLLFCKPGNDLDFYVQTDDTTVLTIKKTLTETFGNTCPIDVVPCSNPIESVYQNDFTCNALLYDPVKQQVLDAYNGLDAIQKRELRIISPPFFFLNPVACFRTCRRRRLPCFPLPAGMPALPEPPQLPQIHARIFSQRTLARHYPGNAYPQTFRHLGTGGRACYSAGNTHQRAATRETTGPLSACAVCLANGQK